MYFKVHIRGFVMWTSRMKREEALFVCRRRTHICRSGKQGDTHGKRIEECVVLDLVGKSSEHYAALIETDCSNQLNFMQHVAGQNFGSVINKSFPKTGMCQKGNCRCKMSLLCFLATLCLLVCADLQTWYKTTLFVVGQVFVCTSE